MFVETSKSIRTLMNKEDIDAHKEKTKQIDDVRKNANFKSQIVIDNKEKQRILKLQRDFKAGLIEEKDLSEEDFKLLVNLYKKQIEEKKQSIQRYKNRIIHIRSKLKQNN